MDLNILLFFVFVIHQDVFGIVIDPQTSQSSIYTPCLASNQAIQIKDPFRPSWFNDRKFISMEWFRYTDNGTTERQLLKFVKNDSGANSNNPKYSKFEFWGLQINDVRLEDSAEYVAKLVTLVDNPEESTIRTINIVVASPPVLESEKLFLSQSAKEKNNTVKVSCGKISSLGSPPINLVLKTGLGILQPTAFINGFYEFTVTSKEAESGQFSCDIDMSEPAAICIEPKDVSRWHGAVTDTSKSQAGSDMIGIIAGVVGGVVLLIVIIIIIFFVLKRRKSKSESYNAKDYEKKRDNEPNPEKAQPLVGNNYENPYDRPYVSQGPIYKGPPSTASPYHVSRISQGNANSSLLSSDTEYEEMNCENGDRPPARPSKFFKKGEVKDKKEPEKRGVKEKEGQKPPRAKPRSIFLTPSMEELDKINTAVAGGEGSGANGGLGTQV